MVLILCYRLWMHQFFFQPKVNLSEVADNLKDLSSEGVDLKLAKEEFINNPIYKDLIISSDGSITAMQIVLRGNDEYDTLISRRYEIGRAHV